MWGWGWGRGGAEMWYPSTLRPRIHNKVCVCVWGGGGMSEGGGGEMWYPSTLRPSIHNKVGCAYSRPSPVVNRADRGHRKMTVVDGELKT